MRDFIDNLIKQKVDNMINIKLKDNKNENQKEKITANNNYKDINNKLNK